MSDSKQDQYRDLMSSYEEGMYTRLETASMVVDLLYTCDSGAKALLWQQFPDWLKQRVREIASEFDEAAPPFSFSPTDPIDLHRMRTELKRWWFDEFLDK